MSKVEIDEPVTTEEQYFKNADKLRIIKNILIISFCFMISIFANNIFNNRHFFNSNYGYSKAIFWAISLIVIVWMFINYLIIRISTIKLSIWISILGFAIYFGIKIEGFGFGSGYVMVNAIANLIFRMCSAQLLISISSHLLDLAKRHKYFGGESLEVRAIRFLGVLNFFQQIAFVLANSWNIYYYNIDQTYDEEVKMNASICIILPVVSALLVIIFLDGMANDEISSPTTRPIMTTADEPANTPRNKSVLIANISKFFQQIIILLTPITLWVGLRSILFSSVIIMVWGQKGYMRTELICYGIISASASLAVGIVIKYCTRLQMFCAAAVIDIAVTICLIVLNSGPTNYDEKSNKTFLTAIMMFEGTAGAIWDTLLPAFYGVVFTDNSSQSTYSKYFGVKYTGIFVVSAIEYNWLRNNYFGNSVAIFHRHIYNLFPIFIALIIAGMLGYFRIEFREQKKKIMSTPHSNPLSESESHEQKGANV